MRGAQLENSEPGHFTYLRGEVWGEGGSGKCRHFLFRRQKTFMINTFKYIEFFTLRLNFKPEFTLEKLKHNKFSKNDIVSSWDRTQDILWSTLLHLPTVISWCGRYILIEVCFIHNFTLFTWMISVIISAWLNKGTKDSDWQRTANLCMCDIVYVTPKVVQYLIAKSVNVFNFSSPFAKKYFMSSLKLSLNVIR